MQPSVAPLRRNGGEKIQIFSKSDCILHHPQPAARIFMVSSKKKKKWEGASWIIEELGTRTVCIEQLRNIK